MIEHVGGYFQSLQYRGGANWAVDISLSSTSQSSPLWPSSPSPKSSAAAFSSALERLLDLERWNEVGVEWARGGNLCHLHHDNHHHHHHRKQQQHPHQRWSNYWNEVGVEWARGGRRRWGELGDLAHCYAMLCDDDDDDDHHHHHGVSWVTQHIAMLCYMMMTTMMAIFVIIIDKKERM